MKIIFKKKINQKKIKRKIILLKNQKIMKLINVIFLKIQILRIQNKLKIIKIFIRI